MTRKPNETNANDSMIPEDDPRITAYALGELSEDDAANLESELSANPEWQETIASVQETAGLLKQALAEEPMVGLTQAHRDAIESRIAESESVNIHASTPTALTAAQKVAWLGMGIAASLFLVFSIALPVLNEQNTSPRLTAQGTKYFDHQVSSVNTLSDLTNMVSNGIGQDSITAHRDGSSDGNTISFDDELSVADRNYRRRLATLGYASDNRNETGNGFSNGKGGFGGGGGGNLNDSFEEVLREGQQGWKAFLDADDLPALVDMHVIGGDGGDSVVNADWAKTDIDASSHDGDAVLLASENRKSVVGKDVMFGVGYAAFNKPPLERGERIQAGWYYEGGDIEEFNFSGAVKVHYDNVTGDQILITGDASALNSVVLTNLTDLNVSYGYQIPFGPFNGDGSQIDPRIAVFADHSPYSAGRFRDLDGDGVPDAIAPKESTTERYAHIRENPFKSVTREPLSTFSIDVDTASYANARRFLNSGQLPPRDAVRIEEFINYFAYDYPQPSIDEPFSINVDVADCPWNRNHRLARIGLQGYEIPNDERPESNLVFLIDVSGSMNQHNKLPLLKQSMTLLVDQLDEYDRVAIVVYAGASGLVLDSITCDNRGTILDAINNLRSGGSTNGAAGIELAYEIASDNFIEDGTNRVILATDGDFNVGVTSEDDLHRLIEEKAKTGVFLSVLGFGGGNYQDATLELLADKGNGNYAYIDTLREAEKVLVEQMGGTLVTIAKDVKIQVEFNPAIAAAYRLIGYENRMLAKEDFNDDTKDAGEIGAGHTVTALYEIVPAGEVPELSDVDPLKYQSTTPSPELIDNDELMTVKVRYKLPDEDKSTKLEHAVLDEGATIEDASDDFRFAAAVASFGMILRNSAHRGDTVFDQVFELAESTSGEARSTDRAGFIELVDKAKAIMQPVEPETGGQ
ncbi:MAG: hypothetical protein DHS20C16_23300 [Phycisphaerae bacterium]|nr:MAG: hypothetical protein DHS20C16_23300 [Phycisphaerae bacterium]